MENIPYYDPRVIIYENKMFIRLATVKGLVISKIEELQETTKADKDRSILANNTSCKQHLPTFRYVGYRLIFRQYFRAVIVFTL